MNISFHRHFNKRFVQLPKKVQNKALERFELFQKDPFARTLHNHALVGKWSGYRSIDITGDYRAIYLPVTDSLAKFYTIDTHSKLYG